MFKAFEKQRLTIQDNVLVNTNPCKLTMQTRSKTKQGVQSGEKDANRSCGRVNMDQGLWRELPAELLKHVLSFLPVPHLCKFRIVCKRWNNLMCSPEFGKLCVMNASKRANEGGFLVVKLRSSSEDEFPGWSILDLNQKRWYKTINDSPKDIGDIVAMDGGLICAYKDKYCIRNREGKMHHSMVMFNLLGGARKVLPPPPLVDVNLKYWEIKLIVENSSNTFKLCVFSASYLDGIPWASIYESHTDQWRNLPNPPGSRNGWVFPDFIAIFQGLLYVLRVGLESATLCSFNFMDNSWEDTGVQLRHGILCTAHGLVVSDNRLFLITHKIDFDLERTSENPLRISEIFLADKECRTVARASKLRVFNAHTGDFYNTRAFGFNKSILLINRVDGKGMLYNLTTGQWEFVPQNPQQEFSSENRLDYPTFSSRGTQVNYLRLPGTPW